MDIEVLILEWLKRHMNCGYFQRIPRYIVHSNVRSVPNSKLVSEKDVTLKLCSEGDTHELELEEVRRNYLWKQEF